MPRRPTGRRRGRPRHQGVLTPAEERVLGLLRTGKTNVEIALTLGLSPDTVKSHVSSMLSKLGLSDRRELAAWEAPPDRDRGWLRAGGVVQWSLRALRNAAMTIARSGRWVLAASIPLAVIASAMVLWRAHWLREEAHIPETRTPTKVSRSQTPSATASVTALVTATPTVPPPATPGATETTVTASCPITPPRALTTGPGLDVALGDGPIYVDTRDGAVVRIGDSQRSFRWLSTTGRYGPVDVRAWQIDGTHAVELGPSRNPPGQMTLRNAVLSGSSIPASWERRVRLEAAGCYALEMSGQGVDERVVFQAVPDSGGAPSLLERGNSPATRIAVTVDGQTGPVTFVLPDKRGAGGGVSVEGRAPAWSRDLRLAVSVRNFSGRADSPYVAALNADGTRFSVQAVGHEGGISALTWSPDGKVLAVSAPRVADISPELPQSFISVLDPSSAIARPLASDRVDWYPVWSPDGGRLAFVSERDGNPEIYVINADGSDQRRLTQSPGFDGFPAWSPDGSSILWESNRGARRGIWTMRADGSSQRQVGADGGVDWFPTWSPDGSRIAFCSNRDGFWRVYVMNPDGSDPRRLTDGPGSDSAPAWAPDGTYVGFISNRDGVPELY